MKIDMLGSRNWGQWRNDGSTDIRPFECFGVKSTLVRDEEIIVYGEQPNSTIRQTYLVNGPFRVAAGGYGIYQNGVEVQFAYDTGTPAGGDSYGWKAGQGTLSKGSNPFITVTGVVRADNKIALGRMRPLDSLIPFELYDPLTPGGTATAYILVWNGSAWVHGETIEVNDGLADNRGRAATEALAGSRGLATRLGDSWYIITMQPMAMLVLAQASAAAAPGHAVSLMNQTIIQPIGGILDALPATAANVFAQRFAYGDWVIVFWNEDTGTWGCFKAGGAGSSMFWAKIASTPTNNDGSAPRAFTVQACAYDGSGAAGDNFTVYSPIKPRAYTDLRMGDVVGYIIDTASGLAIIVTDCWETPWRLKGTLTNDLAYNATASVTATAAICGPLPATTALTGVENSGQFCGKEGTACLVEWNYKTQVWSLYWVAETEQTVMTNLQYDTSAHAWQKKTRALRGHWSGDESSWSTVLSLTSKTFLSAYQFDSHKLQYKKIENVYVEEAGSESGWTDVLTATPITVIGAVADSASGATYQSRTNVYVFSADTLGSATVFLQAGGSCG